MTRKTTTHVTKTSAARRQKKPARQAVSITIMRKRPVQLSIFDYAASIGVTLLPEAS